MILGYRIQATKTVDSDRSALINAPLSSCYRVLLGPQKTVHLNKGCILKYDFDSLKFGQWPALKYAKVIVAQYRWSPAGIRQQDFSFIVWYEHNSFLTVEPWRNVDQLTIYVYPDSVKLCLDKALGGILCYKPAVLHVATFAANLDQNIKEAILWLRIKFFRTVKF